MDYNILIGGEAGQGLKTTTFLLGKILFREGYHVYSTKNYMSRVRGGHNFIKIRFADKELNGPKDEVDMIIALNEETITKHLSSLNENGFILADSYNEKLNNLIEIKAKEIAKEINPKGVNTVFIASFLKAFGFDLKIAKDLIREYFDKDSKKAEDNLELLKKGYESAKTLSDNYSLAKKVDKNNRIYLDGNQAIGMGAAVAGVGFYTAYPMSPSTGILNYLGKRQKELKIAVEQAEDEIGAINMALGAAYGGTRAMVGTSGGGFALMNEGLGMSAIGEIPLVIAEVQRPGPATGLPTRTSQGDLQFVINSSQGEFPLMVIAPRNQEDAFYQSFRAHNLAEKYQIPVIILSDQFLADSSSDFENFDLDKLKVKRDIYSANRENVDDEYKRYELNEDGISPRAYPSSLKGDTILVDSHEHNEYGRVTEDIELRNSMIKKRKNKIDKLIEEDLEEAKYYGKEEIDYLILSWGSTYGPVLEAVENLNDKGHNFGFLSFSDIWPLAKKSLKKHLTKEVKTIVIENNSTSQFSKLLGSELQLKIDYKILKYDGRPFSYEEIAARIREEVIANV
ncbi:MAG: 2-oxoacid:acceptor oxidoreductase subunit alpha [Bacillota bacterium]